MQRTLTFADMKTLVGQELGLSPWLTVTQAMIDQFATVTRDEQWIHIDVERASRESPYGATVAHGFLTLSLIAGLTYDTGARPTGMASSINYGLDKVRFLSPVKAGARIRLRTSLVSFDEKSPGQHLMKSHAVVEIEGEERPALVADTLVLLIEAAAAA